MLSTRRIGARGACRLVDMGPASMTANSASPASMAAHPQHHARQQVRNNYSSLIDPGSAASSGAGGGPGSRAPWQAEENIDIQKVTQTAIVSFAAYMYDLCSLHRHIGAVLHVPSHFICLLTQPSRSIH